MTDAKKKDPGNELHSLEQEVIAESFAGGTVIRSANALTVPYYSVCERDVMIVQDVPEIILSILSVL